MLACFIGPFTERMASTVYLVLMVPGRRRGLILHPRSKIVPEQLSDRAKRDSQDQPGVDRTEGILPPLPPLRDAYGSIR